MTLGRIMRGLGPSAESLSLVKVRWLATLFVIGDVFSLLIQSTGAGMSATGKNRKLGENVVVGGLVIQIVFFGLFIASAVVFHVRYSRFSYSSMVHGGRRSSSEAFDWQGMLNMLYATSALILVRCLFRIVEYVMGADAYPLSNEWMLYVFDALLMSITMAIFYWWYPSQIQQSKELRSSSSIGMMER
jgi:magnesium-transporting ATPase (P-type)